MQNVKIMTVAGTTLSFPKNGTGGATVAYGSAKTTGSDTVFTATGATFGAVAAVASGNAGDYVFTADGHWAGLISSTSTAIVVDRWRSVGGPRTTGGTPVIPANGSVTQIFNGKNIQVGARASRILMIELPLQVATDTIVITDMKGTALYTYTVPATPMAGPLDLRDSFEGGFRVEGPFGILMTGTSRPTITFIDTI